MKVRPGPGIPGIPGGRVPTRTKQVHSSTSGCGEDIRKADSEHSGAAEENESEKDHGHVSSVPTGDPGDAGWVGKTSVV